MSDEIETVGKVADATKEVAVTSGKAIDAASGVGNFFNRVFGELVVDGVGLVADRLKHYRGERSIRLASDVQKKLHLEGIELVRPLHPKIALPLIENASLESNEDLHSMWVNLLATGLDPDKPEIDRKFVSVLADMSSEDALEFRRLAEEWLELDPMDNTQLDGLEYELAVETRGDQDHSIINLNRLGLIAPCCVFFRTFVPAQISTIDANNNDLAIGRQSDPIKASGGLDFVYVTAFGEAFYDAVTDTNDDKINL